MSITRKALSGEAKSTTTCSWTTTTSNLSARTAMERYMHSSRDTNPLRKYWKHSMNFSMNYMMTINNVITAHYKEFRAMVKNSDVAVENGNTREDIFQDVMMTALKKYKGEVDEAEAYDYIKRTLGAELFFQVRRKKRDILLFPGVNFDQTEG